MWSLAKTSQTGSVTRKYALSEIEYGSSNCSQMSLSKSICYGMYCQYLLNELPDNIKAADSAQNFKTQLKSLLFGKEFI